MEKVSKKSYLDARKLIDNGMSLTEVVKLSGIPMKSMKLIDKSTCYRSYVGYYNKAQLPDEARIFMNAGHTRSEALAMVQPQKAVKGDHELQEDVIIVDIEKDKENHCSLYRAVFLFFGILVGAIAMFVLIEFIGS